MIYKKFACIIVLLKAERDILCFFYIKGMYIIHLYSKKTIDKFLLLYVSDLISKKAVVVIVS